MIVSWLFRELPFCWVTWRNLPFRKEKVDESHERIGVFRELFYQSWSSVYSAE